MSIDEPIEQTNVNPNTNCTTESTSSTFSTDPAAASENKLSGNRDQKSTTKTESQPSSSPSASNINNNFPDTTKSTNQKVSTNAPPAAKTTNVSENLAMPESFKEKKQKLTLPLAMNASPSSELSSISSSDSNKPTHGMEQKITNNTTNGDLVKHLDNHNISTPYLDKILFDFNANNSAMKTPGSATIAFLTPNGTFPANSLQTQFSYSGLNLFNMGEFKTPSEENSTQLGISLANQNPNGTNNINNAYANNMCGQFRRQNSELNTIYVNPSEIFSQHEINGGLVNGSNVPKYTTLTNIPNGNSQILSVDNTKLNNSNVPGNYILIEQPSQNSNSTKLLDNSTPNEQHQQDSASPYNLLTNDTNKMHTQSIKDEFQTVPEHPPMTKTGKTNNNKRKSNSINEMSNNKIMKTEKSNASSSSTESSTDALNNTSGSIGERRDTGNSSVDSSNMDPYSPINMDNQARLKIEIKRERNREAARKCRTRKLEKIAHLEIQVKNLSAANELEKAKNESLADEICKIRQKLEMHKKVHNCDLKMI